MPSLLSLSIAKCPTANPAVAKPPVSCTGNCGKLIKWFHKFCNTCSNKLKKCIQCGK